MGQDEEYTSAVCGWPGKNGGYDHGEKSLLAGSCGKDGRLPSPQESSRASTKQATYMPHGISGQ